MDKAQLIRQLMSTFLEELAEHVEALNDDLLALEHDPAGTDLQERLTTLFRTAHSLKGAARSVSVGPIEGACHQLEEVLSAARDGRLQLGPDWRALLLETVDAIQEAGMRLRDQQDLAGSPLTELLPRLEAAAAGTLPVTSAPVNAMAQAVPATPQASVEVQPASRLPEAAPAAVSAAGEATVRVAADKLDMFLARSGELLVARRSVQARAEELSTVRETVGRWMAEWRGIEQQLASWLPKDDAGQERRRELRLPRRLLQGLTHAGHYLRQLDKDLDRLVSTTASDSRHLDQAAAALDTEVRRVRMLPFAQACQGLERMVHDLAQAAGKQVDLVLEGGEVELDRSVLEGLKDPLRHLVRNAVDHGTEPPAERQAQRKVVRARVTVAAVLRGAQVEVSVADDGRGLDLPALRQQLRRRNLPEPSDERELARTIFLPGFSTALLVTDVSGRGVGLDVVKSRIEALHGTVELSYVPGQGTRFTLGVPLTLTTLRAVLVTVAGQTFAIAGTNVQQLVRVRADAVRSVEGRDMLALGGAPLPLASLAEILGLDAGAPLSTGRTSLALVIAAGERRMAFAVDEVLAEQEVVIKGLGVRVRRLPHLSGATLLPSGRIALVLNAASLVRTALGRAPERRVPASAAPAASPAKKRILIAEDSVTTRTLEKSLLEAAGYDVAVAPDGVAAWQQLQDQGADLLVTDLDMPRMDGFALTEAVRGSRRFQTLPVILVTARASDQDKLRGIEVGADAYLVKNAFDQQHLLETIAQLL